MKIMFNKFSAKWMEIVKNKLINGHLIMLVEI